MDINIKQVKRYMGCKSNDQNEEITNLIKQCALELKNGVRAKYTYRVFDCVIDGNIVNIGDLKINSKDLAKNLKGCKKAILFAATLGTYPDFLQKKYGVFEITKALAIQATSAEMIESFCNDSQQNIKKEIKQNQYLRPRFSPGYGDFSINHQTDFIEILDCYKRIGLGVTDSLMLAPTKSVTAVIGISFEKIQCEKSGCEACSKIDCQFRLV